jgi:hypothetical protein
MVIEFVAEVTVFPCASWIVTWTAGAMEAPAVTFVGCTENANFAAVPAVTLNALLVAPVKPLALPVSV